MAPSNRFDISGRKFIVTGGEQGIGFAILEALAQGGANVAGIDIKSQPGEDYATLSKRYSVNAQYFQGDVTNEDSLRSAFGKAVGALGGLDGCVTCAGIVLDKAFGETTFDQVERLQEVNVVGTYLTAQLATAQMKKQARGGSIVLVSSITGHTVLPQHRMSAYGATKGAVKTLSESLAVELAPFRVRTNSISPGFMDTEMTKQGRKENPSMEPIMFNTPPLQRIGTCDDIVGAVIYFLSDASSYTTGTDIAAAISIRRVASPAQTSSLHMAKVRGTTCGPCVTVRPVLSTGVLGPNGPTTTPDNPHAFGFDFPERRLQPTPSYVASDCFKIYAWSTHKPRKANH